MATLCSTLETDFTPAVGDFNVQVVGGMAILLRKNSDVAGWAEAGRIRGLAVIISNPIAGAKYRFRAVDAGVTVQADQ